MTRTQDLERDHGLATARRCAQLTGRPSEKAFVMWARRRGIDPARVVRLGRTQIALYDLDVVLGRHARQDRL